MHSMTYFFSYIVITGTNPMSSRGKRFGYLLAFAILATFGVRIYFWLSQPWSVHPPFDRTNIRDFLTIDLLPESRHRILQGFESAVGEITLEGTGYTLEYDIGGMEGNYATNQREGPFVWQKHEEFEGVKMDYALTKQGFLHISIPELGMANFFTDLRQESDTTLILEFMRTVRPYKNRGPSSLEFLEPDLSEL
jgi:hypothetical protein